MPILEQASVDDRERLLELFPVSNLRSWFNRRGSKEEICRLEASNASPQQTARLAEFLDTHLNLCKQHVYIFSHTGDATLPETITSGECLLTAEDHALYVVRTTYQVYLLDPPEQERLEFLWPLRIEITPNNLVVRFVMLEKSPSSYFARQTIVRGKSVDEETIIAELRSGGLLSVADLNRGIKALWAADHFDATQTKWKKPGSVAWEAMDEDRGIKQYNPRLYDELQTQPMYSTVFKGLPAGNSIQAFSANPTNGLIGFTRYSKQGGDSDDLIRQILEHN